MSTETTRYRIVLDDRITPELKQATFQAKRFDNEIQDINRHSKKTGKSLKRSFGGLKGALGGVAIAAGVGLLAKKILTLGISMEQTRVSFETFLGSAEAGNAAIAELNEFSNVTPFNNEQVLKAGKGLLAFGVTVDDLIPSLKTIGDVSAATGKDFNELAVIYGKAKTQGTLFAEDINQLTEAGVPIIQQFAKQFGVAESSIKKMGSEGKLKFADLELAFQSMTGEGGRFFNLMEKQSQTLGGKISTLVGKLQLMGSTIGEELGGGLKEFVDQIIAFVDDGLPRLVQGIVFMGGKIWGLVQDLGLLLAAFTGAESSGEGFAKTMKIIGLTVSILADSVSLLIKGLIALVHASKSAAAFTSGNTVVGIMEFEKAKTTLADGFNDFGKDMADSFVNSGLFDIPGFSTTKVEPIDSGTESSTVGNPVIPGQMNGAAGVATNGSSKKNVNSGVSGVSSKVRNININIEKLVEEINFNSISNRQSEAELVDLVQRALLTAVNDVNVISR